MRITNTMMTQNMLRSINTNLNRLEKLQKQVSSGQKIQVASDDPVVAARALKIRNYVAEVEQLQKNTDDAKSWMDFSESALKSIGDNLDRIRELTVEASNGTYSSEELANTKLEIGELKKGIIEIGNSNFSGRYVFAGYDTDAAPFEIVETDVGEKILYKGKYLSLGGVASASVSDEDYKSFYLSNMDKITGQPELKSAKFEAFTAADPELSFEVLLDGVSQTITLTDGTNYDIDTLQNELQAKLSTAFSSGTGQPDPLIKVTAEDGKLKLTVQDGTSIQINSGTLDVSQLGFSNGKKSTSGEEQEILYKIGAANRISVNVEGNAIFGQNGSSIFDSIQKLTLALAGETSYKTATYDEGPPADIVIETHDLDISSVLADLDEDLDRLLLERADLGARSNYVELTQSRLKDNYTTFTELLSNNEDVDYAEASLKLASAETVYEAALAAGAKVIQKSLLDFLS